MTQRRKWTYPEGTVRTQDQILAGALIIGGYVWETCGNCGGSGTYPSSCLPPGMCRFYCWARAPRTMEEEMLTITQAGWKPPKDAGDPTYGKRPTLVAKYVKRAQADDRASYRNAVIWEEGRAEREAAAARAEAERLAREEAKRQRLEAELAIKRTRVHLGTVGERITVDVTVEAVLRLEGRGYMGRDRYMVRFRDAAQNQLVLWTDLPPVGCTEGAQVTIAATVKKHDSYRDEAQTLVQRVKVKGATEPPADEPPALVPQASTYQDALLGR